MKSCPRSSRRAEASSAEATIPRHPLERASAASQYLIHDAAAYSNLAQIPIVETGQYGDGKK